MKKEKKPLLIGYYKKSVILTYLSVISAIIGIYIALIEKQPKYALLLLIISGLCDAFDGKVARACKRVEQEKQFGVELDSLADLIAFIMFPIIIFYSLPIRVAFIVKKATKFLKQDALLRALLLSTCYLWSRAKKLQRLSL